MTSPVKSIQYDLTHLRQEFLSLLNDFSNGVRSEKVRNAIGKRLLKHLDTQIDQILTRLRADFCLVVIGDFKRGKSTLINALLGEPVVTTDVTPETVTINQIQYSSVHKIHVCLSDGGRMKLETEDLKKEQLVPILEQLPQAVSHLNIEAPIEWLQGLCLVDTPGTGDILKQFDRQVHAYLLQADAVIFVISALAPFAESEEAFLRLSVIPQDFPKVFFVLNRMDDIRTEDDAERLLKKTQDKIRRSFPNAQLFGLSAFDEFSRIQSLPRPNPDRAVTLEAAFNKFRESLQESIRLNRGLIQLDRGTDHMDQMLQDFEDKLTRLSNALQADQLRLRKAIAQCEDKTSELFAKIEQHKTILRNDIQKMCEQTCQWMKEFMVRLDAEAIRSIPNFKFDEIQRHFNLFLTKQLAKAISECLDKHKIAIIESTKKTQKAIFDDLQILTDISIEKQSVAPVTVQQYSWTNHDTFDLLVDCNPSTFIIDLFIRQTKDLGETKNASNYMHKLQKTLPKLKDAVVQEIQGLYNRIVTKIEQKLEGAYQQDIEASLSAMQQAQELSAREAQKVSATHEGLEEATLLLEDTRKFLKSLKQKLCSEDMFEGASIS